MLEWLAEYHVGLVREVGRETQTLFEHEQILDRIAAHDVEGAAAAMFAHLTRAHDFYEAPSRRVALYNRRCGLLQSGIITMPERGVIEVEPIGDLAALEGQIA